MAPTEFKKKSCVGKTKNPNVIVIANCLSSFERLCLCLSFVNITHYKIYYIQMIYDFYKSR